MKCTTRCQLNRCWERTGKSSTKTKLIDLDKGDKIHPDLRSRLVAKDFKTDNRSNLFAATSPLEALELLISLWMTGGIGQGDHEAYVMNFIAIRRAYFHAYATGDVYVELPEQDQKNENAESFTSQCMGHVMLHGIEKLHTQNS